MRVCLPRSSWARSEVLFQPSIDSFNDYLRDNIQNMTRSYPALVRAMPHTLTAALPPPPTPLPPLCHLHLTDPCGPS